AGGVAEARGAHAARAADRADRQGARARAERDDRLDRSVAVEILGRREAAEADRAAALLRARLGAHGAERRRRVARAAAAAARAEAVGHAARADRLRAEDIAGGDADRIAAPRRDLARVGREEAEAARAVGRAPARARAA